MRTEVDGGQQDGQRWGARRNALVDAEGQEGRPGGGEEGGRMERVRLWLAAGVAACTWPTPVAASRSFRPQAPVWEPPAPRGP